MLCGTQKTPNLHIPKISGLRNLHTVVPTVVYPVLLSFPLFPWQLVNNNISRYTVK